MNHTTIIAERILNAIEGKRDALSWADGNALYVNVPSVSQIDATIDREGDHYWLWYTKAEIQGYRVVAAIGNAALVRFAVEWIAEGKA